MNSEQELFSAKALDSDGNELGRIEGGLFGNIDEFYGAHLTRTPWDPGQKADKVIIQRGEEFDD